MSFPTVTEYERVNHRKFSAAIIVRPETIECLECGNIYPRSQGPICNCKTIKNNAQT